MKTAGYDIALLINERFLNQLSGALFYSGFLTINGSVDFYNGTLMLEHQVQDFRKDLSQGLAGKVEPDLQPFLLMDFRLKLTREPLIDFLQTPAGQGIRFSMGMRIYFWLWQGLELKFDADVSFTAPIYFDAHMNMIADLVHADVQELTLKYGSAMQPQMAEKLDGIVESALHMYFANHTISQPLSLPSIGGVMPEVKEYIQPGTDPAGNELGIIPISVAAIRLVSPTVMALGINLMDYAGGNPNQLSDFALNCSLAVGISEIAMQRVFSWVWTHSHFSKHFGKNGGLYLVKDDTGLTASSSGNFQVKKLDEVLGDVVAVASFITDCCARAATLGFLETEVKYKGGLFDYDFSITLKNEPKFDLLGGNLVKLYNMAFDIYLRLAFNVTVEYKVELDTSGFIPDSWTPWDDDITLHTETQRYTIFDKRIHIDNLELHDGQGKLEWDEDTQTLNLKITKIDLYWNFNSSDSPLAWIPEAIVNWVIDQLEGAIVKQIPTIAVTPKLTFDLPLIHWPLKITGRKLEITNSEAIVAADFAFEQLEKDAYPVAKYIVNVNNGEIHKIGCDAVMDTYEVHQRAYHLLSDALAQGYDGCKKCLPAFHTR
jgi:hypothetical protein